jgi:hypothetical protein
MRGRIGLLVVSCSLFLFASQAFADTTVVARLDGAGNLQMGGKPRLVVAVDTIAGKHLQIGVENKKEDIAKADPKSELLDQIKSVAPGDIIKLTYAVDDKDKWLKLVRIEPYPMQPGMELPNAYIFHEMYDHTDEQKTHTLVDVKRFDDLLTFAIPVKKDASGAMVADPDLVATIGKIKDGQVVLIDSSGGSPHPMIHGIEVYNAPRTGTIKEIKPADLNGNKTTEADIEVDGSTVTVLVPGKMVDGKHWVVDSKILGLLHHFKAGATVTFRTVDDGGTTLLRDIKAAPKPAEVAKSNSGNKK